MSGEIYLTLKVHSVLNEDRDLLSSLLFDLGAQGISENLAFTQLSDDYQAEIMETKQADLVAYFDPGSKEQIESGLLSSSYSKYAYTIMAENVEDWMEEWKKYFKTQKLAEGLCVSPSWLKGETQNSGIEIFIDPGLAFGTGTHPTTQMCLRVLHGIEAVSQYKSALDVGTGSGVLSVLLSKMGFASIRAIDNDEMALDNCRKNFELNGVKNVELDSMPIDDFTGEFDLVVANIIDGVLLKMQNKLIELSSKHLILSGILRENEERILSAFVSESSGLVLSEKLYSEEWVALCLEKKA